MTQPADVEHATRADWPGGISDGLNLACSDCGQVPRFDYHVAETFWHQWVPDNARLGVVCLPCLDARCNGVGLAEALEQVQWTGTGHTVVLSPTRRIEYARLAAPQPADKP